MEALTLLAIGAGLAATTTLSDAPNAFDVKKQPDPTKRDKWHLLEFLRHGDVYHVHGRSYNQAVAQLTNVTEPLTAPRQKSTSSVRDVFENRAANMALLESQAPAFHFGQMDEMNIHYGNNLNNNGYNLWIPYSTRSIPGDDKNTFAKMPRVFIERYHEEEPTWNFTHRENMGSGEPSEHFRPELGDEADVPVRQRNPYGPFGHYQDILRRELSGKTKREGHLKPEVLAPPPYKGKPWNKINPQLHDPNFE